MLLLKSILGSDISKFLDSVNKQMLDRFDEISNIVPDKNLRRRDLDMYCLYPYIFWEDFQDVGPETMLKLVDASIMYFDVTSYLHEIGDSPQNMKIFELWQKLYECQASIKGLVELFGSDHRFWDYFNKYNKEYLEAVYIQEGHRGKVSKFDFTEFKQIAAGKSAIAKTAVAALACLSGSEEKIPSLERSQNLYACAFQLYDDLKDWKDDLVHKNYTWLLTELITKTGQGEDAEPEDIRIHLFQDGYDFYIIDQINKLLEESMLHAGISKPWIKTIRALQNKASKLKDDLESIKAKYGMKNTASLNIKTRSKQNYTYAEGSSKAFVEKSIQFLQKQHNKDFPELTHWLFAVLFASKDDLTGREECLGGDIFQRALMLNLLKEISSLGYQISESFCNEELDYLLHAKHIIFKTGWSYFPELPEYCCDVDTASEYIKLATVFDNELLHKEVRDCIDFIMKHCSYQDGSFDTFLLDKNDTCEEAKRALKAAELFWGRGADVEVNANLVLALHLYDPHSYQKEILRGLNWILSLQHEEGYWESTWYEGKYYGSYICAKLLSQMGINSENAKRLFDFLTASQNRNGSWGIEDGNVQDTSLALTALIELTKVGDFGCIKEALQLGCLYIQSMYSQDCEAWYGVDFIKINMWRTVGLTRYTRYRSSTLTTCFCAYALARVNSFLQTKQLLS